MSKVNKKQVEKEAKEILDRFSKALNKVKFDSSELYILSKKKAFREDSKAVSCDDFKEKWLPLAPKTKDGFVHAEKGSGVK